MLFAAASIGRLLFWANTSATTAAYELFATDGTPAGVQLLDLWNGPTQHLPKRLAAARAKYAEHLEHEVGNL